jgi:hypothetical protein
MAMSLIEEIRDRFSGAGMKLESRDAACRVLARDERGFDVWVEALGPKHWRVGFADWCEDYTDPVQVLACFALGLSNHARLEVKSRAGRDFRWTVQQQRGGVWVNGSSVEKKAFSIWPVVRTRLLQNDWLRERPVISDIAN